MLISFSLLQTYTCQTDQQAYQPDNMKKYKLMIVPFDYKMYISSLDRTIASKTRLTYAQIRENMRYGLANQFLLVTRGTYPAISLLESDSTYDDLKYIYNSIGYKYKLAPIKEEEQEEKTKIDKLKNSLSKLINKAEEKPIKSMLLHGLAMDKLRHLKTQENVTCILQYTTQIYFQR